MLGVVGSWDWVLVLGLGLLVVGPGVLCLVLSCLVSWLSFAFVSWLLARMQHFDRNKEDLVYPVYLFQRCFICHERQKWHIQVIYDKK